MFGSFLRFFFTTHPIQGRSEQHLSVLDKGNLTTDMGYKPLVFFLETMFRVNGDFSVIPRLKARWPLLLNCFLQGNMESQKKQ